MSSRVRLCARGDVEPGQMLRVDIAGVPPLAAFNIDGEIHCTSNLCTHQFAILTDGFFEDDVVECPLHGGCFNVRTGAALEFPCKTPLRTYPVTAVGEDLYVDIE
ncbi:ethylbenzene dioxygenase ferredoxin subunit [Panacagrimonas perspica]|uniref:Ethylbenzene dioxygenase ferredoxin subunit n=1 Tax=Panacagrimonas perspica TaxID=381431 RepID=A0A4R7PDC3_9GAMM|nr:non-heme iron oxygenase ferredoxin subunit [Panacagrimonas perspica]TDU31619.1 ethylbenzene dioxygenase ferredoxin subunit [Panacagrimonas perspica]THD03149.1 (2Fe-2S)-binding protein [Panacagrimonas perspica]